MEMQGFQYIQGAGWTVSSFPDLDSETTLVLVFAAPICLNNQESIIELTQFYKKSQIIGCSTAGEIFGAKLLDNSLSVMVVRFKKTRLKMAKAYVRHATDSFEAGKSIANQLLADDLSGIFVLSDGLNINGSQLVKGLNEIAKGVVITGGLAGDGPNFQQTRTLFNDEIVDHHVVAIGFYGKHIKIGHASRGGWDMFGPSRRITSSKNNVLYELDNMPALVLYKEYLGERASELPASGLLYPLAISDREAKEPILLVRTILAVDETAQSLIFAGDMPQGYYAQMMCANFDRLIMSANEAGEIALSQMTQSSPEFSEPVLVIGISCVGRRLVLGERIEEEIEAILESFSPQTKLVGFYSYGELSPYSLGKCELHNQTMTITTFSEA